MRLASLGGGRGELAASSTAIKAEQKASAEAEERRIFYVAITRAERHLILSGATDLEKLPEPPSCASRCAGSGAASAPGFQARARRGSAWTERDGPRGARGLAAADAGHAAPSCCRRRDLAPGRGGDRRAAGGQQAELELAAVPAPRALPVSRLSYSGLEAYRRCSLPLLPRARRCACAPVEPPPRSGRERAERSAGLSAAAARQPRARAARAARLRRAPRVAGAERWRR